MNKLKPGIAHILRVSGFKFLTKRNLSVGYQSTFKIISSSTFNIPLNANGSNKLSNMFYGEVNTLCNQGRLNEAFDIIEHRDNAVDHNTYACLLKGCVEVKSLAVGKRVHAHMARVGFEPNVYMGNMLINMYVKCGSLEDARQVFDKICNRNVFSWSAMIGGYAKHGQLEEVIRLFHAMQREGVVPDNLVLPKVLKACAHLEFLHLGREIHGYTIRSGFESYAFVANSLVDMYAKCGNLENARDVFDKMSERDEVSWNAMIAGYASEGLEEEALKLFAQMQLTDVEPGLITWNVLIACYAQKGQTDEAMQLFRQMQQHRAPDVFSWTTMISRYAQFGHAEEALEIFREMQRTGTKSNSITMASAISACAHIAALCEGKEIHGYAKRSGQLDFSDVLVGNALIDMYSKCGCVEGAQRVFDKMAERDVISWNSMIAGCAQAGLCDEAFRLFDQMHFENVKRNVTTWNAMMTAYIQNGHADKALKLFQQMESSGIKRNVISWNTLIAGHAQNGHGNMSFTIFRQMQLEARIKCNIITILSVVPACAHLAALKQGKEIHNYITCHGFHYKVGVGNALVDMYAKCGSIENARRVFDKMPQRDLLSWNAMIAGYGLHGFGNEAITLFNHMQQQSTLKPDHITFTGVLSACSHAGLVEEGWKFFDCMTQEFFITPTMEHYACMVDLLGRSGQLDEAQEFISNMPLEPNASVWGALLGACRIHFSAEIGRHAAEHLFELEPENAGHYVSLSNIYVAAGRWNDAKMVRKLMEERGAIKSPGCSWFG